MDKKTQTLLRKAFERGVANTVIHAMMPELTIKRINALRGELGFTAKSVVENRYNSWKRMLEDGYTVDVIAQIYNVKPRTVQYVLWTEANYSFRRKKRQEAEAHGHVPIMSPDEQMEKLKKSQAEDRRRMAKIKTFSW